MNQRVTAWQTGLEFLIVKRRASGVSTHPELVAMGTLLDDGEIATWKRET